MRVNNEIGRLREVLVHRPGTELLAVTPATRRHHLYDDIVDLKGARVEHQQFVELLSRFADVLEIETVLEEALELAEAREFIARRSEEMTADHSLSSELSELPASILARRFIEGWPVVAGPFSTILNTDSYHLPPQPNLMYMRDATAVVGVKALVSAMRFATRWPESGLMRTVLGFHARFSDAEILFDGSDERRPDFTLEGGDIHPLREDLVLVGISERTSVAVLDEICERFFGDGIIRDVLAVILPKDGTAIHLDMVWTQVDREQCVIYPPGFVGIDSYSLLHRTRGQHSLHSPTSLFDVLRSLDMPLDPIFCGGENARFQQREQWAAACNFLALAPGLIVGYARNEMTFRELAGAGFRLVDAADVIADVCDHYEQPTAIMLSAPELVRGGGGTRCMTCPIVRDDL